MADDEEWYGSLGENVTMGGFAYDPSPRTMNGVVHGVSRIVVSAALGLLTASLLAGCSRKSEALAVQPISQTTSGLVCANPKWDLGEVLVKGESVDFEHTFRLENRSEKTIKLRDVQSECSCLVAGGYAKTLEPGGETEIKVKLSVFGPPGAFHKTLIIAEESESNSVIPLSLDGRRAISDWLYSSPPTMKFGTLTRGESKTKPLVLCRYDGSPVNFRDLVAKDHSFSLGGEPTRFTNLDITGKSCDCVEVPVRLDSHSEPVGFFRSILTIRTHSAEEGTANLDVEIEATVVEEETPWVRSIFLSRLERGQTIERPMTNQGGSVACPEILSTSYEGDDSIRVEVVHASPDGRSAVPPGSESAARSILSLTDWLAAR